MADYSSDYTYNTATDVGKVRALIGDTTTEKTKIKGENYVFDDTEIENVFLELNGDDVWAAAADACRRLAADEALGAVRLKLSGMEIDKRTVPKYWLELATRYDQKSIMGDTVEYVDSFVHEISEFGEDDTEYVGDPV
jgi:hypothetical protein